METMETIGRINAAVNSFVWGPYMLALLVGTGIYMSIRVGLFQVTKFNIWARETYGRMFEKNEDKNNISPFQAVATALASTIGVGSIAGVSTAIVAGGPGALFWMAVAALFGMITKFSEVTLAIYFREKDENGIHYGGPMYYMEKGLKQKWLAILFTSFAAISTFGTGNMTQCNAIAGLLNQTFNVPPIAAGVVIAILIALVILGGIKRISGVCEKLVPFMAVLYFVAAIVVLVVNRNNFGTAISSIISNAFNLRSAGSGVVGYTIMQAMRYGVARGVFSNEAGLGTAPMAHAASNTKNPVKQGMYGIFEVFNTLIICMLTGLIVTTSNLYISGNLGGANGAVLTSLAFKEAIGFPGEIVLTLATILFAFSTLVGWSYYGETCLGYLSNRNKKVIMAYKMVFIAISFVGSIGSLQLIWDIADTFNGLMSIPNLISILILSPIIIKLTKGYLKDPSSIEMKD